MQNRFGLRSTSGKVERKWRAASSGTQPERNAAAEPQTEAGATAVNRKNSAPDERALCAAERAWSRGGQGRPAAREAERSARWSGRARGHGQEKCAATARGDSIRFQRWQSYMMNAVFAMNQDTLVVAEIAEFVHRDFVLRSFGVIDIPFADGV
jgi:hypothetical protein